MDNRTSKYAWLALGGITVVAVITLGGARAGAAPKKTGGISADKVYTVTATQPLANNAFAPPLEVSCNAGDAVLSGSCTQEVDSVEPIAIHESAPLATHDGWRCRVSNEWSSPATLRATAVCYSAQ